MRVHVAEPLHPSAAAPWLRFDSIRLCLHALPQGKFDEAAALYQNAIAIFKTSLGPTHPNVGVLLSNTAVLLWKQGDFDGALPLLEEANAINGGGYDKFVGMLKAHDACPF